MEYLHHVGPKNTKPPKVTIHQGQQFEDLMKQHTSLNKAMQLDFEWLIGLHKSDFSGDLGAVSIRKTVLPGMAIPMLKMRRPNGRLIFNMEIAIRR